MTLGAITLFFTVLICSCMSGPKKHTSKERPNIILVMADDLGWGDVAYNGNKTILTPHLDAMAASGVRFNRFYAAAPVCSPTRASCLTGRHPYRYNIPWAGDGHLPPEEITIAEALKTVGYATGHFGKWHVGGLSRTVKQSYFPGGPSPYAPPWENGFDECFTCESMMPTYNPYYHDCGDFSVREGENPYLHVMNKPVKPGDTSGNRWRDFYWTGSGEFVDENLAGDSSRIIMDRALEFIARKSKENIPFFSCIWFNTPHTPIVAGDEMRRLYPELSIEEQHWYGCVTAMDKQIGRLRQHLKSSGISENTILWFCSDNGPSYIHDFNSTGGLRGKKATLWEGGIRVPAILEWPGRIKKARVVESPVSTCDFYPTLLSIIGIKMPRQPILDGIDVLPFIEGQITERSSPIGFQAPVKRKGDSGAVTGSQSMALIGERYKLTTFDGGATWQLYDLIKDEKESTDIKETHPDIEKDMKSKLERWVESCVHSAKGDDYQ